jgi:adenylate kinase
VPLDAAMLMDVDPEILLKRSRTTNLFGSWKSTEYLLLAESGVGRMYQGGRELIQRDDNEATIRNRLDVYRQQTEPLIAYYRKRGKLREVDADGSIDDVYARFRDILQRQPA